MTKTLLAVAFFAGLAAPAMPARALEPINRNQAIVQPLLQGFIADRIADECPSIEPRKIKAKMQALDLANQALKMGYTRKEIEAFVKDKDEKARGKAEALAYLIDKGAIVGQPETFCRVGEAEIAAGSLAGQLLRKR
ncbi:hypothetical protein E7811_11780 [Aliigemmobacter aestuarii]|uniref:DUF5333 domain-containing protein n=1 Tax=Aliigemmobacter aestuarii TaxID=1445661 RepID=A0A4S3MMT5_9RHOB|nr:DUF5333 domain-containing protein [Gemmobacter aestuarii]THD82833.1 hypothetical protein E7811_11780 [Gemmobacter aestuarii]